MAWKAVESTAGRKRPQRLPVLREDEPPLGEVPVVLFFCFSFAATGGFNL